MTKTILKRDGRRVPFNREKIREAVSKASKDIDSMITEEYSDETIDNITDSVLLKLEDEFPNKSPTVNDIQVIVENTLMSMGYVDIARAYIIFRNRRDEIREAEGPLMKTIKGLTDDESASNDLKRENANIDGDTSMGTMLRYGTESSKFYSLQHIIPKEMAEAHKNGDIHIHDMDFYNLTETCCQIPLDKLFKGGFSTGHGYLREPNSIQSYAALAAIAIQSNQNDQHGGQSVPAFDFYMAPGIYKTLKKELKGAIIDGLSLIFKKDYNEAKNIAENILHEIDSRNIQIKLKDLSSSSQLFKIIKTLLKENKCKFIGFNIFNRFTDFICSAVLDRTERATYQSMEGLVHNLCTMQSRCGSQVPFSSINYGTDTSEEGRMVIKQLLLATEAGLGNGETPIFPIQIFKVKEGVNYNEGDPNYDLFKLAIKVSAKRLFPNFSFIDAPFNLEYYKPGDYNTEISYMGGCKLQLM